MDNKILKLYESVEPKVLADPEGIEQASWAKKLSPCTDMVSFIREAIWVIMCSGISYKAARSMQEKYYKTGVCKHPHKAKAIHEWSKYGDLWWSEYCTHPTDKARIRFLRKLPYMGGKALVYQLAKNLGITGYCKPDVHLIRLASLYGYSDPQTMCEYIAKTRNKTIAYIDTILWFSAMKGWAYTLGLDISVTRQKVFQL